MFKYLILFTCLAGVWTFDIINVVRPLIFLKKIPGNTQCVRQLNSFKNDLLTGSDWAVQMADASGKLQSGFLEGNFIDLGHFDECLKVKSEEQNIRGKYCLARLPIGNIERIANNYGIHFPPNKQLEKVKNNSVVGLVWGLCIPDGCSADEVTNLTNNNLIFAEYVCQTSSDYPEVTRLDYVAAGFFITIFAVIISSTAYDLYLHHNKENTEHRILLAFSFYTNGKQLFKSPRMTNLTFINGMRSISTLWIILGHMYSHLNVWGITNMKDFLSFTSSRICLMVISAHMAVDTFLLLSGLLLTYSFMKAKTVNLALLYANRYYRLTVPLAVMVLLHLTFIKFALHGPLGTVGKTMYVDNCENYWWSSLLHLQNLINPEDLCTPISWYLSVDMQLFLLAPLILIPLKKYPKPTLIVITLLIGVSTLVTFCIVWIYKIEALFNIFIQKDAPFTKQYYYQTYTRASPWLIGVMVGYFIYEGNLMQRTVRISKKMVAFLWTLSLLAVLMCIFGGHELLFQDEYNAPANSAYLAFVKIIWSIAVSWIVYACATGNGGPVTWFLSLPIFGVIASISYSMYLLHYTIFGIILFNKRKSTVFSNIGSIYDFCGHCTVIGVLSVFWYLSFEKPFVAIKEHLIDTYYKKNQDNEDKTK